jgi:hypothetical protein
MRQESKKEAFYSDAVTLLLVVPVVGVLALLLSLPLPGDRVNTGLWLTGSVSTGAFFYLRGKFGFWPTLGQILAVGALTAGQVWLMGLLLSKLPLVRGNAEATCLFIFHFGLFCVNKQATEYALGKWGIRERARKPTPMT